MGFDYLTRNRRIFIVSLFIFILAGVQQTVGWIFITGQYLYKNKDCTFYLSGYQSCPFYYTNYYYEQYINCDSCQKAEKIQTLFIAAIIYPLTYLVYTIIFMGLLLICQAKKQNAIKSSNNINNFSNSTIYDINLKIRDASIGLGILCILKIFLFFGLYYDVHQYIFDKGKNVQQPVAVIQQQPIIIYQGMLTQRSQVDHNGQYNNNNFETIPNQNDHPFYDQKTQQYNPQQPVNGQQIYDQPVKGLSINHQPDIELEVSNQVGPEPIEGLAIKR
ncbi:hypothetical protein pb186bvf_007881 [Paramecium bursaria]